MFSSSDIERFDCQTLFASKRRLVGSTNGLVDVVRHINGKLVCLSVMNGKGEQQLTAVTPLSSFVCN